MVISTAPAIAATSAAAINTLCRCRFHEWFDGIRERLLTVRDRGRRCQLALDRVHSDCTPARTLLNLVGVEGCGRLIALTRTVASATVLFTDRSGGCIRAVSSS